MPDYLLLVLICTDETLKDKSIVDSYIEAYEGLCNTKKVCTC